MIDNYLLFLLLCFYYISQQTCHCSQEYFSCSCYFGVTVTNKYSIYTEHVYCINKT